MTEPLFLPLDEVLGIHADQIRRYGGRPGLRDLAVLQSALGMPETTFEGQFLPGTLFEMAAAYLFHIARNHPFVDGNERTALCLHRPGRGKRKAAAAPPWYSLANRKKPE